MDLMATPAFAQLVPAGLPNSRRHHSFIIVSIPPVAKESAS